MIMSNFENTLNSNSGEKTETGKPVKKKLTFEEQKALRKKELDDAARKVVSSPETLRQYLDLQSRFERYSANNNLLIFAQRPDATRLKSMELWNADKKWVKEKAKAIYIYEPKDNTKDGKKYTNFVRKSMFDISDIKDPDPEPKTEYDSLTTVRALFSGKTVDVVMLDDYPDDRKFGAFYDADENCIYAKKGMNHSEIFVSVSQALAHAEMARNDDGYVPAEHQFEAKCAAYILAKKYGMPTDDLTFDKVPGNIASADVAEVRRKLATVNETVKSISKSMYKDLTKDKDKETPTKEKSGKDER